MPVAQGTLTPERSARWQQRVHYQYVSVIETNLRTTSPLSISTGDADASGDQPLLRNVAGQPYIPATSFVGALRHELSLQLQQLFAGKTRELTVHNQALVRLFGVPQGTPDNDAEPMGQLWFDDLELINQESLTERRDHVRIDRNTGTAADKAKFDRELLAVGSRFGLRVEWRTEQTPLAVRAEDRTVLLLMLAILEGGAAQPNSKQNTPQLALGGRTRRGMGQILIDGADSGHRISWRSFDLRSPQGLCHWMLTGSEPGTPNHKSSHDLAATLAHKAVSLTDHHALQVRLDLCLRGSMLVRGAGRMDAHGKERADASHLRRPAQGKLEQEAIIPASSMVGVLRHRAEAILRTLTKQTESHPVVEELFGSVHDTKESHKAGSLHLQESLIRESCELRHTRVCIDPWTGGALDSALFTEDALYGGRFTLELSLRRVGTSKDKAKESPSKAAMGLLLLTLRDLWEGDLPIGGESSVGRGFVRGVGGQISCCGKSEPLTFDAAGRLTSSGHQEHIHRWVQALNESVHESLKLNQNGKEGAP